MKKTFTFIAAVLLIMAGTTAFAQDCQSPPTLGTATFDTVTLQLTLTWTSLDTAAKTEIQIREVGDSSFARIRTNSNDVMVINGAAHLSPGMSYEWRVRYACSIPPDTLVISPLSPIDTFTIPLLRTQAPMMENNSTADLFPIPATENLTVNYTADTDGNLELLVFDMTGRLLQQQNANVFVGNNSISMDLTELESGNYVLQLNNSENQMTRHFSVNK